MKKLLLVMIGLLSMTATHAQNLQLNDLEYFERQGGNVLVFSNSFNGGFNDEKNSGIEIIHHGVRTVQGGAVRMNNTPEQCSSRSAVPQARPLRELRRQAFPMGTERGYYCW